MEETEILSLWQQGDQNARNQLVNLNLGLAMSVAQNYIRRFGNRSDLRNVAAIGLLKAIDATQKKTVPHFQLRPYILIYVKKECLKYLRWVHNLNHEYKKRFEADVLTGKEPELAVRDPNTYEQDLVTAFKKCLTDKQKIIFDLRMNGNEFQRAAALLGVSKQYVSFLVKDIQRKYIDFAIVRHIELPEDICVENS